MDFWDVISQRRSIRAFTPEPLDDQTVRHILEAANLAPSAGNRQAYEIYVVKDLATRQALAYASSQPYVGQAPVVLVFCTNGKRSIDRYGERGVHLYALQDASIATTHAMLACTALGLGSVWIGAFDEKAAAAAIRAPVDHRPVAMLPIGFAAQKPAPRPRRELTDIVHQV
jgi:nitroreductase